MSYSVNWFAKEIFIPKSDLILIDGNRYKLLMNNFHKEIRRLESTPNEGLGQEQILIRQPAPTYSGQTGFPTDTIINNYSIIFDPSILSVLLEQSNNNIIDVFVPNGVSVIPTNSFGNSIVEVNNQMTQEELREAVIQALQATTC